MLVAYGPPPPAPPPTQQAGVAFSEKKNVRLVAAGAGAVALIGVIALALSKGRTLFTRNVGTAPHPVPEGWTEPEFPRDAVWSVSVLLRSPRRGAPPAELYRARGSKLGAREQANDIVRTLGWMGIDAYAGAPRLEG